MLRKKTPHASRQKWTLVDDKRNNNKKKLTPQGTNHDDDDFHWSDLHSMVKGYPMKTAETSWPRYLKFLWKMADVVPVDEKKKDERMTKIVLVGKDTHDLIQIAKQIKDVSEVYQSDTGLEHVKEASECEMFFVVTNFEGELFSKLHRAQVRIIGTTIVKICARDGSVLPLNIRPLFCLSMQDLVICLTGFRNKQKIIWLVDHVHYMGGSVRKDESIKLTHMVANITHGTKYRYAVNMGKPIMCEDWINRLWADREDPDSQADQPKMAGYRMKPFYECCLSFLGFTKEEQKHMEELTIVNGGSFGDPGAPDVTHLVIDDQNVKEVPQDVTLPQFVVRGEWFWGCIQMTACADEQIYAFEKTSTPARHTRSNHSMAAKNRKRKRLQELVAETEGSPFMVYKRRSSSADISAASMSPDSFLDVTYTPDKSDPYLAEIKLENREDGSTGKLSKRQMVVMELLQTEQNYVGILHTILHIFKAQIEKPDQYNGPLLAAQDTKIIFGNIPPIYEAHCKLRDSLAFLVEHWSESNSVGECILNRAEELMKAYPPFVNFFEKTKETIQRCDSSNPRFHAFLKLCLSKPECGRQSLQELLIRPVQRLPSVVLLLQDLLKRTESNNPDKLKLEMAIEKVKTVMTHINEDKRKTESRVVMFDIINDIDSCPATLLSSNRHFVMKVDVMELSGNLSSRGDPLTLFIFSDSVEICKRRLKVLTSSSRSPAVTGPIHKKAYKHLDMIAMSSIKRVVDVEESEDCCLAFGLICRDNTQVKEKLYSFTLVQDEVSKEEVLTSVCKNLAIVLCRPDIETFLARVSGEELNITTKDLHKGNKASKFGRRVSRAFSFNKTPSKLKRAVSGMVHGLSPFVKDSKPFTKGEIRRLASTFDLTEANDDDSDTVSLGAFSMQDHRSPSSSIVGSPKRLAPPSHVFLTPKSLIRTSKTPLKWATIGPSSASKTKYM